MAKDRNEVSSFCPAPIVSSISSKDGFSPRPHGPGLFFGQCPEEALSKSCPQATKIDAL
jgi:hypothetical protein